MRQNKFKVFISGNQKELVEERHVTKSVIAEDILLRKHFDVFIFEDIPAKGKSSESTYIGELKDSDVYIGILGKIYGAHGKDGISATEREFRYAKDLDKEILIFIKGKDDSGRDRRLDRLIEEIKEPGSGYVYKRFIDAGDLRKHIYGSLVGFLEEKGVISKLHFDASICPDVTDKDIDIEKLKWFLETAKAKRNYPFGADTPFEEALTHLHLLRDNKLTNASIILFGKTPQKHYLQAEVKCIHFHGTEVEKPFETYHIYKGNAFDQIDNALGFVLDRLKRPVIPEPGKAATKRPFEIPEFVIREAIVNAVAHRDYYSSAGVQVMVFIDRIEVWNPGKLPPQLTIDLLKKPHPSFPHNPLICEPLYLANYVEKAGSGTVEMIEQCKKTDLPEPDFMQKMGHFITVIWRDIYTDAYLSEFNLNERQMKAIRYMKEKRTINNNEYQGLTGVSKPTASRDLAELVSRDIFKKIGVTGKGTQYVLKGSQRAQRAQGIK